MIAVKRCGNHGRVVIRGCSKYREKGMGVDYESVAETVVVWNLLLR
jgi:hypothetical protein